MGPYAQRILDLIEQSDRHWTAEQLFLELKQSHPKVVLATVYNNLNALYTAGQIQKVSLKGQADRFDKAVRHDHLVCKNCHSLSDIHLEDLTALLNAQLDSPLLDYELMIHYVCPACRGQAAKSP